MLPNVRRLVVTGVLALTGTIPVMATAAVTSTAQPAAAASTTCASVFFYGVRGSGETPVPSTQANGPANPGDTTGQGPYPGNTGLGTPIGQTYNALAAELPAGVTVQAEGDGYPAVSVPDAVASFGAAYATSMGDGVADAVADLDAEHAACPSTTLVVAGYSQGADVIRRALNPNIAYPVGSTTPFPRLNFTPTAGKDFLLLFGDLDFHNEAGPIVTGGGSMGNSGLGLALAAAGLNPPVPSIPSVWHTVSFCHSDDIVCQFSLGSGVTQHTDYGFEAGSGLNDGYAAAWRIMQYFGWSSPSATVPTATMSGVTCVAPGSSQANVTLTNDDTTTGKPVTFTATFYDVLGLVQTTSTVTVAAGATSEWGLPLPNVLTGSVVITTPLGALLPSSNIDAGSPVAPVEDQPASEAC